MNAPGDELLPEIAISGAKVANLLAINAIFRSKIQARTGAQITYEWRGRGT
jgi:hypothetical protein